LLNQFNKTELKKSLFDLFDIVLIHLKTDPNVDTFLDNTLLFEEWEQLIPEAEYPIFIMAVLNNIRRPIIIDTIISSILNKNKSSSLERQKIFKNKKSFSHSGEHPFN
jgi:hypothetical protein|tara:strand:- start:514 stop:837 length:324 start_codon:yes stop_codon:yes gene_type:complete